MLLEKPRGSAQASTPTFAELEGEAVHEAIWEAAKKMQGSSK